MTPFLEGWRREVHPSHQGNSSVFGVQGQAWPLQLLRHSDLSRK